LGHGRRLKQIDIHQAFLAVALPVTVQALPVWAQAQGRRRRLLDIRLDRQT
jgi:hypothetical protein